MWTAIGKRFLVAAMKANTTTTTEERAALAAWYGPAVAPKMEERFATASQRGYDEAAALRRPGCAEYGASKAAARRAAWAILRRASEAAAVVRGGAR